MIAVIGSAGTIGRHVAAFLEEWGVGVVRRDFRLEGDEYVDARDSASLSRALDGAAVVVNCADYRLNLDVMRGAAAAGAHYLDLGGLFHVTKQQLELDGDFRDAGLTAVLGMSSAPGKTNLLAAAAARRLGADPVSMEIWAAARDPAPRHGCALDLLTVARALSHACAEHGPHADRTAPRRSSLSGTRSVGARRGRRRSPGKPQDDAARAAPRRWSA